ncbi:MAG: hypothetical protein M1480_10305 [Bacteroidetes bacterium]|nr:hypothetical protein [Bacteroidota bacterium]
MNNQKNATDNSNMVNQIKIETVIDMALKYVNAPTISIQGSVLSIFEEGLLEILHKRNIQTIDKVGTNHLVMLLFTIL